MASEHLSEGSFKRVSREEHGRTQKSDESQQRVAGTTLTRMVLAQIRMVRDYAPLRRVAIVFGLTLLLPVLEGLKLLYLLSLLEGLTGVVQDGGQMSIFSWDIPIPFVGRPISKSSVSAILACLVLAVLLQAGARWLAHRNSARTQQEMLEAVRGSMVDKLFSLGIDFFNTARTGELAYMINAEVNRTGSLVPGLSDLVARVATLAIVGTLMASISDALTLVILAAGLLLFIGQTVFVKRMRLVSFDVSRIGHEAASIFHEILYGIRLVRSAGLEEREKTKFLTVSGERIRKSVLLEDLREATRSVGDLGLVCVILCVFMITEIAPNENLLADPGRLLAYLYLVMRAFPLIMGLNDFRMNVAGMFGPLLRIEEFMAHPDEGRSARGSDPGVDPFPSDGGDLVARDLRFSYGQELVIDGVTLSFQKNEITAVVGLSGSGKSTLFDLLSGFRDCPHGRIDFCGVPLSGASSIHYGKRVGYASQEPIIFHDTVIDNIRYFRPEASEDEVVRASELARISEFIEQLPEGYHTLVGERGTTISGGQAQRIALARIFLQNPQVMLLDEATSSLDLYTEAAIYRNLMDLKEDRVVVVAAHRLTAISSFDRIVVLHRGRLLEQGSHAELLGSGGLYATLSQLQTYSEGEADRRIENVSTRLREKIEVG